jgi:hypothetical protein
MPGRLTLVDKSLQEPFSSKHPRIQHPHVLDSEMLLELVRSCEHPHISSYAYPTPLVLSWSVPSNRIDFLVFEKRPPITSPSPPRSQSSAYRNISSTRSRYDTIQSIHISQNYTSNHLIMNCNPAGSNPVDNTTLLPPHANAFFPAQTISPRE